MKVQKEKLKSRNRGITLIALVITIIVLLILAGISISMLSGDNSILQRATEANTKTAHSAIYEGIQLEYLGYLTDKKAGKMTQGLVEYLQEKGIIQSEYQEGTGKYQINAQKILGSTKYGKGNATVELKDVYMLEKENTEGASIKSTKIASTNPVKISHAEPPEPESTSNGGIYQIVYYGTEGENSKVELGSITDINSSSTVTDNSEAVIAYYNAEGNYNWENWSRNRGINPQELTFIGIIEARLSIF